jgi:hypothetical protein
VNIITEVKYLEEPEELVCHNVNRKVKRDGAKAEKSYRMMLC